MKISISGSIVLYNSEQCVREAIISFLNTELIVKLFLIDNSPHQDICHQIRDLIEDERVEYIFNNKNIGFGAGHNIAIRKCFGNSQYHLVLNPDIFFDVGVLEALFKFAEQNKNTGLLMPKIIYPDGSIQYTCKLLPTPMDLIFRRFLPNRMIKKRLEVFELRNSGYNTQMEVPYLSGCFMFLRTEALQKIGLFDERFFMYPEDIDITRRMLSHYKTIFFPHVTVTHKHARDSYKNFKLLYIHIINMIKYFNKWGWILDEERRKINKRTLSQFE